MPAVLAPTIGVEEKEFGGWFGLYLAQRLLGSLAHKIKVIAVGVHGSDAVRSSQGRDASVRGLAHLHWRINGVEVVLTDKKHAQIVQRREVQGFSKDPLLRGSLAEKSDCYIVLSSQLVCEGQSGRDRNRASDDGHRTVKSRIEVEKVHRSATPC